MFIFQTKAILALGQTHCLKNKNFIAKPKVFTINIFANLATQKLTHFYIQLWQKIKTKQRNSKHYNSL